MGKKYRYKTGNIELNEIYICLDDSKFLTTLVVGLRLEDLKTSEDACALGYIQVDDNTFFKAIDFTNREVEFDVVTFHEMFISGFIFQFEILYTLDSGKCDCDLSKYFKNSVIGPLNSYKNKNGVIEISCENKFYSFANRILLFDSMESSALLLDKL